MSAPRRARDGAPGGGSAESGSARALARSPAAALVLTLLAVAVAAPTAPAAGQEEAETEARARAAGLAELAARLQVQLNDGTLEGFMALWSADALYLEPFDPARAGRGEVSRAWAHLFTATRCECRVRVLEVDDTGEWAWIRAHLGGVYETPGNGPPVFFDDQLLLVAGPSPDGRWRVTRASRTPVRRPEIRAEAGAAAATGAEVSRDIVYASPGGFDLTLDLWGAGGDGESAPGIVLVPERGQAAGEARPSLDALAGALAARGYVVVSIDTRVPGEAAFPAAVEDARAAVGWLRAAGAEIGVDPDRIAVAGAGTGAWIASLVALTGRLEGEAPPPAALPPANVRAAALLGPVTDLVAVGAGGAGASALVASLARWLGGSYREAPERWRLASPLSYVTSYAPPVLLLHGSDDAVSPRDQSLVLLGRLAEAEVYADLFTAGGGGHAFYLERRWLAVTVEKIDEFLRRVLAGDAPEMDVPER